MQLYIEPDRLRDADEPPTEEKQYNLNLKVTRQLLSRIGKPHIVADSYNYLTVGIEYGEDWAALEAEGFLIYAVLIAPDGRAMDRLVTGAEITKEQGINLSDGTWLITLHADKRDESHDMEERITTNAVVFEVFESGLRDGEAFALALDESTRILTKALKLIDEAREIAARAEAAETALKEIVDGAVGSARAAAEAANAAKEAALETLRAAEALPEVIEAADEAAENARIATEDANTATQNARIATEDANTATENAQTATKNAQTATREMNALREVIQRKLDNGELKGEPGEDADIADVIQVGRAPVGTPVLWVDTNEEVE